MRKEIKRVCSLESSCYKIYPIFVSSFLKKGLKITEGDAVAEEVDRAYEKQAEMARQARMELRKEQKEKAREELKENMEILSANFTK
jgi:phosphoribosylformylglycinamidine (FGAM) synthase PurS component